MVEELIFKEKIQPQARKAWISLKKSISLRYPEEYKQLCFVAAIGLYETYLILKNKYEEKGLFNKEYE